MDLPDEIRSRYGWVGRLAIAFLALHVFVVLLIRLLPDLRNTMLSPLARYANLVSIGPFFREHNIQHTPYLYIHFKKNNQWDVLSPQIEFQQHYYQTPWRYDYVMTSSYSSRMAQRVAMDIRKKSVEEIGRVKSVLELKAFIDGYREVQEVDSIAVTYVHKYYVLPTQSHRIDTLFHITYRPD